VPAWKLSRRSSHASSCLLHRQRRPSAGRPTATPQTLPGRTEEPVFELTTARASMECLTSTGGTFLWGAESDSNDLRQLEEIMLFSTARSGQSVAGCGNKPPSAQMKQSRRPNREAYTPPATSDPNRSTSPRLTLTPQLEEIQRVSHCRTQPDPHTKVAFVTA